MLINKITTGYVIQVYDTEEKAFVGQTFVAGDQVDWEDEAGNPVDCPEHDDYLPFDMVQP